jgi:PQQ-dependent catabolism-associated beta-propeller protein
MFAIKTATVSRIPRPEYGRSPQRFRQTIRCVPAIGVLCAAGLIFMGVSAAAKDTGQVFVSNEKSSTLTILDKTGKVLRTLDTCARPRGMTFNPARTHLFVGCGDDNTVALYDVASLKLERRYRNIAAPETFDLHPDGRHLYISNEDDSEASVLDTETGQIVAKYPTGPEPEGVLATGDGERVYVASEIANLVHVIDVAARKVVKDVPVGTRPRRFALTPDGKELWVSAELSGQIDIIDTAKLVSGGRVEFQIKAIHRDLITPVDLVMTKDGKRAYVALGRANHVAVVDVKSRTVLDYILVGKRPWGLRLTADEQRLWVANGLSDDVSIIDTKSGKVIISVPVGQVPYGILIDE